MSTSGDDLDISQPELVVSILKKQMLKLDNKKHEIKAKYENLIITEKVKTDQIGRKLIENKESYRSIIGLLASIIVLLLIFV
jgi:hypothetical protein